MSLSLAGVCRGSALVLLHGIRPAGVKNGICTPVLVFSRLSLTLCNHYSSSKARLGLSRYVASRLRWANEKYEKFLQRRFPRFYVLYHTFMTGFQLLFQNAKEVRIIKTKMISNNVKFQNLSYREMETLRQFRRDMIKAIPLVLISIPPFANYLVFVLMYLFPRQLLIRHFWTPRQQVEFQRIYHSRRAENHAAILTGLTKAVPAVGDSRLQSRLLDLCNKVQSGLQPSVPEIQAVKGLFSGPPLGMKRLDADHVVCSQNAPSQPISVSVSFAVSHRLRSQALELLQLDRALHRLGVHELSESELRQACYLRGVDSSRLSVAECQDWLIHWLKLSNQLKESETSLLLHSMVLLSANYPKPSYL